MANDDERLAVLEKRAALGELGAGIVHETRNLLTAIAAFAQVGEQRGADPTVAVDLFARIVRESGRCLEVLDRFLAVARDGDCAEGRSEPLDVNEVVRGTACLVEHRLELAGIQLDLDLDDGVGCARASACVLMQVLLNLLVNAMHATPAHGRIRVATRDQAGAAAIVVSDSGRGVPAEARDHIFEAFFTTKGDGTGLGLSLSRELIERGGGSLVLDPQEPGAGASFRIALPAADETPATGG